MEIQTLSSLNMALQWIAVIGSICALVSAIGLIFTRKEISARQADSLRSASEAALAAQSVAGELQQEIERVKKFSYVATLTFNGSPSVGGDITVHTPISRAIEGTWTEVNPGTYRPSCDASAIQKSLLAIKTFPEFPFTYYSLAICFERMKDAKWRVYADQAIDIFQSTTKINGHQESHDLCLRNLLNMTKQK